VAATYFRNCSASADIDLLSTSFPGLTGNPSLAKKMDPRSSPRVTDELASARNSYLASHAISASAVVARSGTMPRRRVHPAPCSAIAQLGRIRASGPPPQMTVGTQQDDPGITG